MGNKQARHRHNELSSLRELSPTPSPRSKQFGAILLDEHCDGRVESCSSINRIANVLQKYALWIKINEQKRKETEDINGSIVVYDNHKSKKTSKKKKKKVDKNGIYTIINNKHYNNSMLLQDYDHIVNMHHYHDIHTFFMSKSIINLQENEANHNTECDPKICVNLSRNNRDRKQLSLDDDIRSRMYFGYNESYEVNTQQILDQIHCYIYHCYQLGYKINQNEMKTMFQQKTPSSVSTVNINNEEEEEEECILYQDYEENEVIDPEDSTEEIRKLSKLIATKRETLKEIRKEINKINRKFITNVENHPYCNTERDEEEEEEYSLLTQDILNEPEPEETKTRTKIEGNKEKESLNINNLIYNFGERYYYWSYYKGNDWFVEAKYTSFKQELLHKISLVQYEDLQTKAYDHKYSVKYKSLIAGRGWWQKEYNIPSDAGIQQQHILALLLYCNFENIHRDFAATYTKNSPNEENKSLKYRHSYFAHFGCLLRECVEVYGKKIKDGKYKIFYHGIDREMLFLSTISSFKGPLSVSSNLSVLQLFCGEDGLILELKKNENDWNSGNMKYFDVGSMSDFGGESELFFIGGQYEFCFDKIIHSKFAEDYKIYLKAINIITTMIKADRFYTPDNELDFSDNIKKLIIHLFRHEVNRKNVSSAFIFPNIKNIKLNETEIEEMKSTELNSSKSVKCLTPKTSLSSTLPIYIDKLFHSFCSTVIKININWYWMENQYGITNEYKGYKFLKSFLCYNNIMDITDNQQIVDFIRIDLLCLVFKNFKCLHVQNGVILTDGLMEYIWTMLKEEYYNKLKIISLYKIDGDKSSLSLKDCYLKYKQRFMEINYKMSLENEGKWDAKLLITIVETS